MSPRAREELRQGAAAVLAALGAPASSSRSRPQPIQVGRRAQRLTTANDGAVDENLIDIARRRAGDVS